MKSQRNIFIAFILNLLFSVFELIGAALTGSAAILSDALHDAGDALSIGISWFLEKLSKKQPDQVYTYGYGRYCVAGSLITTLILLVGSFVTIYHAVCKILHPTPIHYNGMLFFAVVGVCVNFCGAYFTRGQGSLNQKAVNLHMLEDVLGWLVILVGAVVMRFTDLWLIDPILSICVSCFVLLHAFSNLKEVTGVFLEKAPADITVDALRRHILELSGVVDAHHIHLWSIDGQHNYATMHIVTDCPTRGIQEAVRKELSALGIDHVTIETEASDSPCSEPQCFVQALSGQHHHHHHP